MRKQIPMALIIFLILTTVQTWMVHAENDFERVNAPLPEISDPVAVMDGKDVIEWTLDDAGQWESSQVSIPRRWNDGQFNSITKVKVQIGNQNFSGLIFSFTTGDYSYPESSTGWYSFDYHYLYVFKTSELDNFLFQKNIPKKPRQISINVLYKSSAAEINLLPRSLQRSILNWDLKYEEKNVSTVNLRFNLLPLVDQGLVRFTVLEASVYSYLWRFRKVTHANIHANLFLNKKLLSPSAFKQNYYEVDLKLFNQLLPLQKELP